ncbi:MAG: protein translocase subunit SecD [Planctomycetaceae bacterium]|nr:MAG: protein translocase subunit SecD [Planctomycetaceae bacterium]
MDCLQLSLLPTAVSLLAQGTPDASTGGGGISAVQYAALLIALAVLIVPFLVAGPIARWLRMPDYATRIGFILLAIVASVTVLSFGKIGLGVDLRGGTILVYEIDPSKAIGAEDDGSGMRSVSSSDLIPSLIKRINPSGTQEIVIRPYGENQIEIIIPEVDQREVNRIKTLISQAGILRFAILANRRDHQRLIEIARTQSNEAAQSKRMSRTVLDVDDKTTLGFWALVDREERAAEDGLRPLRVDVSQSILRNPADGRMLEVPAGIGGADGTARWMQSIGLENIQVLMAVDAELDVTGEDLAFSSSGFDRDGSPLVRFKLNDAGAGRFLALTTNNAPDGPHRRQLGIVLDEMLLSAPAIQSPISGDGQISGNFTTEEVNQLVQILQAGQLPAAVTKAPIAENQIDATLGADTIRKGLIAIVTSLLIVLVFILVYYRFIGMIACLALVLNLLMILAVMILINQPLTLPGLAGLVLTVGMSVDANVLIFERIREELKKGAAARMAIRNGFARATTTIIDANLTTLITAIVLYAIGTDQIRGFAVTLILGILFSMFTAIYLSRTLFDIAERKGVLSLSMSDLVGSLRTQLSGGGTIDFMGRGPMALALSGLLLIAGIVALVARGGTILDIDFSGGSSVTFRLEEPVGTDAVRAVVAKSLATDDGQTTDFTVNNVTMDTARAGTVFKVDTSIESVDELKVLLGRGFEADGSLNLVTYELEIAPADPPAQSGLLSNSASTLVVMRAQDETEPAAADDVPVDADDVPAETPADSPAPSAEDTPAETAAASDTPAEPESPAETEAPVATEPSESPEAAAPEAAAPAEPAAADAPMATEAEATEDSDMVAQAPEVMSRARVRLGIGGSVQDAAGINSKTLLAGIARAAEMAEVSVDMLGVELIPQGEGADQWSPDSELRFSDWEVGLPIEFGPADEVMLSLKETLGNDPIWISSSSVGRRVAGDMISRAFLAMFASLLCIIGYIWFRFQRVVYGLAAVAALVHDVLITLGAIAVSYWLAGALGFLLIENFKISLTVVAALLTVIGYSLNDTIVVFDRIRETKGKSPRLTSEMVNESINSTLSRTLLTSLTTLIVVGLLYAFGGDGIHAFAFSLVVGVLAGTYSSIFVASPILLWLVTKYQPAARGQ